MCGRFVSASPPAEIARYFAVSEVAEQVLEPNFNVAPTADVFVVFEDGGVRRLDAFHWGLVPRWAKDPSIGNRMINARAEGLAEKNAFKWPYRKRRCIVPADGFYEWRKVPGQKTKQPYYVHRPDGEPLPLAGLWEEWRGPDREGDQRLRSVTIVTTDANEAMALIHDRMPVVLPPNAWDRWLDRADEDLDSLGKLLVPAPPSLLRIDGVGTEVNDSRSTGAHLIEPAEPEQPGAEASSSVGTQGTLL